MKKAIILILIILLSTVAFADQPLNNESKYGFEITGLQFNSDYPGSIKIEGVYVYRDQDDYVFTLLYSNGKLAEVVRNGTTVPKTSFFNPPGRLIYGVLVGS
ncbi:MULTISPECIES: hypothetical protein [unclassified Fusibacter]|uniref:hypothetical protein n=1 Tax=unclassified Fusibacter TaxID=2624464 RepID=UPI0010126994|nr:MULTISPECIES: hypothetical protein [unclassified Fusibacter]MCK8060422.1 hypothetical protein [Fusibacter sp. A2]NPE20289.1 hypothetical protein [Fusibacter sp. A1]RXV63495.1 hypothetical protein DWB64_00555 [Fusibacter sp. A1]